LYKENARIRNDKIRKILTDGAYKIRDNLEEKVEMINRRMFFAKTSKYINNSGIEIKQESDRYMKIEEDAIEWYFNDIKKEREVERQFSYDNIFHIDKVTWDDLRNKKLWLKFENKIINDCKYAEAKKRIKRGVRLDVYCMKLMKNCNRVSMLDTIDEKRANHKYIELLKEININQRILK
jgi:hypothetical protein